MAKDVSSGVPDVLETLAQLPNDEVFTAPRLVNKMLDVLPEQAWTNPTFRWLDPGTKSGVFLREVGRRLMDGLQDWQHDPSLRRQHIFQNMLFGSAITALSGELSRRSVYQTSDATGESVQDESIRHLVVPFNSREGNILFVPANHEMNSKRQCKYCRAPEKLIRENREQFAHAYTHDAYPTKEMNDMKFDVIVGNPPYQLGTEGHGATASPIYQQFVDAAIKSNPRYVVMITPSRWFAGGKGLTEFRDRMINDRHLKEIIDYPNGAEIFPSVEVKGGISYFLWDREWSGDCKFSTVVDGQIVASQSRDLRLGKGVVIRDNNAISIIEKVLSKDLPTVESMCSVTKPFGLTMRSNYPGSVDEYFEGSIPLIYANKIGYSRPDQIQRNHDWINRWKVLLPMASDGKGGVGQMTILGEPIALAPGSACTQTYFIAGMFDDRDETLNFAKYLTTKFVRFLVAQRKLTQHVTPNRFAFVPQVDFNQAWEDEKLYELFELSKEEIDHIEKSISSRDFINSLDSPIPATHLPGGRKYKQVDVVDETDAEDEDE